MLPPFDYFEHRRACRGKQAERAARLSSLPPTYHSAVSTADRLLFHRPIAGLVADVQSGALAAVDVLRAFGRAAVRAHERTNCVTEVLVLEAERWLEEGKINLKGPLAGVPISLKDTVRVKGYDASCGYSKWTGQPWEEDGGLVRLLKDAGAVPFVKTNIPITLMSFESTNDVWGVTENPHVAGYSPGGSTGGEAALLAASGSRIGIGSDVAGSVRVPAHFSGCYALRCSTFRWPRAGGSSSMPGQEGVPAVVSPMARTLDDLTYLSKSVLSMKPWRYDYSVVPMLWREDEWEQATSKEKLRIGVMYTDGVVDPSPACRRALDTAVLALEAQGHTIEAISPPSPARGLRIASVLVLSDGCTVFREPKRTGEWFDRGAVQMSRVAALPRFLRRLYALYVRYIRRDPTWADLLCDFGPLSAAEQWKWAAKREAYRAEWHAWWESKAYDFLLAPPNATPAVPHGGMHEAVSSCGYTFLFNLLDYTASVLPVTHVDRARDDLPTDFRLWSLNGVARGAIGLYDADGMHGLPVGVQVIGRRLQEERVLAYTTRVKAALDAAGGRYQLLELD